VLGEVCHRLVDVFLWQLFPDGLQSDFQLINRLGLRLKFILLFQHGAPDMIIQWVQIWRVWGHRFFSMNPGVRLQPVRRDHAILLEDKPLTVFVAANGGHFEPLQ